MRSVAQDIAEYISDAGIGVFGADEGWSVSAGWSPDTPDNAITVYTTGGGEAFANIHLYDPTFQVRVRSFSYEEAHAKQYAIQKLLLVETTRNLGLGGNTRYIGIWSTSDVLDIGRDENNRFLTTANYRTNRQPLEEL